MYKKDRFHVPGKSNIGNKANMDRSGHVSQTSKKKMNKIARINATPQVIRACICILRAILQVTQRVPPTCIMNTSRTE